MSYCVHCGVKLSDSENRCPLCGTPVIDPHIHCQTEFGCWSDHIDTFPQKQVNWQFVSKLMVLFFAVSAGAAALCDLVTTGSISWSWFAFAGCSFCAGTAAIPALPYIPCKLLFPFAGAATAMFFISVPLHGYRWLLYLALPSAAFITVYTSVCLWLAHRKKLRIPHKVALCLLLLILSLVTVEILTDLYIEDSIHIFWSLYAVIPLSLVALFFTIAAHNRRIVEYIKKNTFI